MVECIKQGEQTGVSGTSLGGSCNPVPPVPGLDRFGPVFVGKSCGGDEDGGRLREPGRRWGGRVAPSPGLVRKTRSARLGPPNRTRHGRHSSSRCVGPTQILDELACMAYADITLLYDAQGTLKPMPGLVRRDGARSAIREGAGAPDGGRGGGRGVGRATVGQAARVDAVGDASGGCLSRRGRTTPAWTLCRSCTRGGRGWRGGCRR